MRYAIGGPSIWRLREGRIGYGPKRALNKIAGDYGRRTQALQHDGKITNLI
jgi:hypothetical protein